MEINNITNPFNYTNSISIKRGSNNAGTKFPENIDLHNISPNDLGTIVSQLVRDNKIPLKDAIKVMPIQLDNEFTTKGYKIRYYSEAWDNPTIKRDMISIFKTILTKQTADGDTTKNKSWTLEGIELLERIQSGYYSSIL